MRENACSAGSTGAQPATGPGALGNFASLPTAAGGITRLAAARLSAAGVDLAPLLERAGLSLAQVEDRNARLGVANQIQFLNLADSALRDPFLGFNLARTFDLQAPGNLPTTSSLRPRRWARDSTRQRATSSITNEAILVRCQARHDFSVAISYLGVSRHRDRHQLEFCMTAILRLCRAVTNRSIVPRRVSFGHQRSCDAREMTRYFGCAPEFGASADEVAFDLSVRDLPHADPIAPQ